MFLTNYSFISLYMSTNTTGNSSIWPFACTLLNCSLWLKYGVLINHSTMMIVNATGDVVALICIYMFHKYSPNKASIDGFGLRRLY